MRPIVFALPILVSRLLPLCVYIRTRIPRRERLPECVPGPCTELGAKPDEYLSGEREWQKKRGYFCLSLFSLLDSVDASELGLHYTEQQRNAEPQEIVDSLDMFHKEINMPQALFILSAPRSKAAVAWAMKKHFTTSLLQRCTCLSTPLGIITCGLIWEMRCASLPY
jgi:hypothetical protein